MTAPVDHPENGTNLRYGGQQADGDITAAFSSNGNNPVICKYLKERNQKIVSDRLAECNEILKEKRKELMDIPYSRRSEILMELLKEYMGDKDED